MSVIPCQQNAELKTKIVEFAEVLKTQSHQLGEHGLTENEFYNSGLKLPLEMGVLSFVQNVDKELRNGGKASTCGIHAGI